MANALHSSIRKCWFLLVGLALAAGCQSNRRTLVNNLPTPNFNGPVVNAPAPVAPAPVAQAPATPPQSKVADGKSGSVPKEWLPRTAARPWKWIVIHHSATTSGSASVFDRMHKDKGWDELGYHFVIGNGSHSRNGQVEVGSRWSRQKWGAHAKTPDNAFNDFGIGICLVGNFDIERPTPDQTRALTRLVAHLMKTYRIPAQNVIGHGETKATDCPGRNMNVAAIRRAASQMLADAGNDGIDFTDVSPEAQAASGELAPDESAPR
jgi:hypothetical protein